MSSEIFWRMNTETNVDDKAMGEKHAPTITVPDCMESGKPSKIQVGIGNGQHPNTNEHHIQWIELRMAGLFIGRVEFAPVVMEPMAEFTVNCPQRDCEISAIARCNLHGLWESKITCTCK